MYARHTSGVVLNIYGGTVYLKISEPHEVKFGFWECRDIWAEIVKLKHTRACELIEGTYTR